LFENQALGTPLRCLRNDCTGAPAAPASGSHTSSPNQIIWNWNAVPGADGYKWNTINDYATATDMGTSTTKTETGLAVNTTYTRFVWAYNPCGTSAVTILSATTIITCSQSFSVNHTLSGVVPVNKTTSYGTVSGIPGEPNKCWITSNLGSDHQATAVNDATEASAGWYWQFNRKQGYRHDGTTRTPNTTWITSINEISDWITANDPCNIELGTTWRIPTYTEWYNVDDTGGWTSWTGPWDSGLKLHAAGYLNMADGSLSNRGSYGKYWSSKNRVYSTSSYLFFSSVASNMEISNKAYGFSIRCVRDY
jgi:hypothetical protein